MTVADTEMRCVTPGLIFTGNTGELISRSFLLITAESQIHRYKDGEAEREEFYRYTGKDRRAACKKKKTN